MKVLRHTRVVFGISCSPFILAAVIQHHLKQEQETGQWTSKVIKKLTNCFYVDNCVTSVNDIEEYNRFKGESVQILASAKMELRQWERSFEYNEEEATVVLGLHWNKKEDSLSIDIPTAVDEEILSKRKILSSVQKIFDPLGVLYPILLQPKLILQETWELKLGWDDRLPPCIQEQFQKWREELPLLKEVHFPQNAAGGVYSQENWQIHTFGDASKKAYAAAVFLRTEHEGNVSVQLLQAKSRVAPVQKRKRATIPRLELLVCTIASRLTVAVLQALDYTPGIPVFYWSDSTTALAWIRRNDVWGSFVGNRVKEICRLTQIENWRFVPGNCNPADLPSRGCTPAQLLELRWSEGPHWLKGPPQTWPTQENTVDEKEIAAEKKRCTQNMLATRDDKMSIFHSKLPFESYRRNVRVVGWIHRALRNWRNFSREITQGKRKPLDEEEYSKAEQVLLRAVQEEYFTSEKMLAGLRVEKDKNTGLFRVRSKLLNKDDYHGFRFPIVLPRNHDVVDQLIMEEHKTNCHAGVQFLMGKLRENFWILQSRRAIRSVLSKCVRCRRFKGKRQEVESAPLPQDRVTVTKVFEVVGIDFAGPLCVKVGRGKTQQKVWIVLFTCAVYRCIHLELALSLSTQDFLSAFSNFISRRGRPSIIYSDNETNFVGADNLFQRLNWEEILESCAAQKIKWKFNPPSAPWWGGWWERLIRSVKELLRKTLGNEKLTYPNLSHLLIKIEGVIKGRPLTTVTEDQDDLIPLTPNMFLTEIPCVATENLDACGFQRVYAERKGLLEEFMGRFRNEYLAMLVQKKKAESVKLKEGDVVLIGAENMKRWEWPMAKVVELFPGKDGHVRVAKVRTASGFVTRPVQRLYPLEVSSPAPPVVYGNDKSGSSTQTTRLGRRIITPRRYQQE